MSTESAIGRVADSIEKMGRVGDALDKLANVIKDTDFTPSPTRKQFVREAAVKLAAASLSSSKVHIVASINDGLATDAIKLAEQIWDRTMHGV